MAALRELLAVYGALDAVVSQPIRSTTATPVVDRYLPAASEHSGWYNTIETTFFGSDSRQNAEPDLTLATALEGIVSATAEKPLTTPQKSRLLYALASIEQVRRADSTLFASFAESDRRGAFIDVLATLGPDSRPIETRRETADVMAEALLEHIAQRFTGPRDFDAIREFAVAHDLLVGDALYVPECFPYRKVVHGRECIVVDTVCRSPDVSLQNMKAVVNPFNWDSNYPDFFCSMRDSEPVRTDGWGRVLEQVGFCGTGFFDLKTALKFYPSDDGDPSQARLDYDLDDPAPGPGGDGQVVIDRGWINMRADNADHDPTKPGVTVQTRKVVHILGWEPYVQGQLVSISGYGTASAEFLFGKAKNPPVDARPFHFLGPEGVSAKPGSTQETPSSHFAPTAVKLWTDTTRDLTNDYVALAQKWLAGRVTLQDLATYSATTSGRLVSAPWKFLDAMSHARYAPSSDPTNEQQGGGS
jgi:hypothetical protein